MTNTIGSYIANWKARIIPSVIDETGKRTQIKPYASININFNRQLSVVDSVDDGNVGYIFGNRRYTFSIEVYPTARLTNFGDETKPQESPLSYLNSLLLNSKVFDIELTAEERDLANVSASTTSYTWSYDYLTSGVVLKDCVIQAGGVGTYDTTASLKTIRFDGLALGIVFGQDAYS